MINSNEQFVMRIANAVPAAEEDVDTAMASLANLMATLAKSRREANVPPATGQATLLRLAKAQLALVDISSEVLRAHTDLLKIGQEYAGMDIHEDCPPSANASVRHLSAVS